MARPTGNGQFSPNRKRVTNTPVRGAVTVLKLSVTAKTIYPTSVPPQKMTSKPLPCYESPDRAGSRHSSLLSKGMLRSQGLSRELAAFSLYARHAA